ncbi:uncharacterized protein LOC136086052 [Hydra vulgaris]|uniref:Uncharacterized protein LOC136086052 n=1 Tax=Hydra vulgaris TaxID=6087 RepID=A0ABM4CR94_HYDVU
MWMRRIFMERSQKGLFNVLVKDLKLFDSVYFFQSFRMSSQTFEILLSWVAPFISKSSLRRAVATAEERLCIALSYLVTGDVQITIAIRYLLAPSSQKEWLEISSELYERWNFPHCLGAIDGKHVIVQSPAEVAQSKCNAKYEFTLVDIGGSGRQSDGGIYNNNKVGSTIVNNLLNFPNPSCISGYSKSIIFPYTFLADEAFALKPHMMRPYPRSTNLDKTVFNYRLSRGRRVIEYSFGVLASRFRLFRRPIVLKVENVKIVVKANVALHNFLMKIRLIIP